MVMAQPDLITLSGVVVVVLVNTLREQKAWAWMRLVQGPGSQGNTRADVCQGDGQRS